MSMPTEKPLYTVIVDEELLKKIDDFRFENRYPSWLLPWNLYALVWKLKKRSKKRRNSFIGATLSKKYRKNAENSK